MNKKYNVNCPLNDKDQILLSNNQTLEDAACLALDIMADGYFESNEPEQKIYDQANITLSLGKSNED